MHVSFKLLFTNTDSVWQRHLAHRHHYYWCAFMNDSTSCQLYLVVVWGIELWMSHCVLWTCFTILPGFVHDLKRTVTNELQFYHKPLLSRDAVKTNKKTQYWHRWLMHDWLITLLMLREPSCGINLFGETEWMFCKSFYLKYVESWSDICTFYCYLCSGVLQHI